MLLQCYNKATIIVMLVFSVPYSEVFRDRFFSIGVGEPA